MLGETSDDLSTYLYRIANKDDDRYRIKSEDVFV